MKSNAFFDGKHFKINLHSESQEESAEIYRAVIQCKAPVESYGGINKGETWAWFFLPISDKKTGFENSASAKKQ